MCVYVHIKGYGDTEANVTTLRGGIRKILEKEHETRVGIFWADVERDIPGRADTTRSLAVGTLGELGMVEGGEAGGAVKAGWSQESGVGCGIPLQDFE